jgi:MEMO1 family protein
MSIVLAAFVPHTPLLLPTTDSAHRKRVLTLKKTYEEVVKLAHAAQVQTIIAFSPHAISVGNAYTFNLAEKLESKFEEFGDMTTVAAMQGNPGFLYHIKEQLEAHYPVTSIVQPIVNYGSGIPMYFFQQLPKTPRWAAISIRNSSPADHVSFGIALQSELQNSSERVLLLANGDVTARLNKASPEGFSAKADPFWQDWKKALKTESLQKFLENTSSELAEEVGSCGTRSVAMLAGALNSMQMTPNILYSDSPYGVGYQVVVWQPK